MTSSEMAPMLEAGYPVEFDIEYPESPNRWMILIRWLLAIPHLLITQVLGIVAAVFALIAFFSILFTKKYPPGLAGLVEGWMRWSNNMWAYVLFLDRYPPFSWDDGAYPQVTTRVHMPPEHNRWLPLVKWILAIPHFIVLYALQYIAMVVVLFIIVAVLVTGRYPRGAFNFMVGTMRWYTRVYAYMYLLVDRYPPFSLR